jgi:hypothetical protein
VDKVLHDIRNELAVAIASVQAFIDRKLEPNAETLGDVLAALEEVNRMLPLLREPREQK